VQDDHSFDEYELVTGLSISSDSNGSDHVLPAGRPAAFVPPKNVDPHIFFDDASMELIEDVDDGLIYQEESVYDDDDKEDWWNEFCVPDHEEPEWSLIRVGSHNIHSRRCRR